MPLLPDPGELLAVADRIDRQAAAARARAQHLGAAVAAGHWRGAAADAFHAEAHVAISALRTSAGRLDDAADALRRHAGRVGAIFDDLELLGIDSVQALADAALHPGQLLADARQVLADGGSLLGDALDLVGL